MDDCLFCKIVRADVPAAKVYEDDKTLAFLDINPVNPGHTLIVPKAHAADVFEIDEADWSAVMKTARTVAHALEKSLQPDGINLAMNNRKDAGQVIFHAHVHVMPRYKDDGFKLWKGTAYPEGDAEKIVAKIRKAL